MRIFIVLLSFLFLTSTAFSETIRDYYAEPGLHPFKENLNQSANEHIDPFSGGLTISHADLVIPGNGGLDIRINRIYNSLQDNDGIGLRTVTGVGWTIHFGRVVVSASNALKICAMPGNVSVSDNPSLELSDGSRQLLVYSTNQTQAYLVTKNHWKAECKTSGDGLIVTSPDGTQYVMDQYEFNGTQGAGKEVVSYYTSKITDINGNSLSINYSTGYGFTYIDNISASDGRYVDFTYINENTAGVLLSTITANGRTWQYNYIKASTNLSLQHYYHLSRVISPELDVTWNYSYHPLYTALGAAGSYSLQEITYPSGGKVQYVYAIEEFNPDPTKPYLPTTVVSKKTMFDRSINMGEWLFDYQPASTIGTAVYDKTIVTAPNGRYEYKHVGYSNTYSGSMWQVGLLYEKKFYSSSNVLIQTEVNEWLSQLISSENYWHGRSTLRLDSGTYTPLLSKTTITRDGTSYITDYLNYDSFGNAGRIVETANTKAGSSVEARITDYTYYIDVAKWIVKQVKDETTSTGLVNLSGTLSSVFPAGKVERIFYPNTGLLQQETKFGLIGGALSTNGLSTNYTYTPDGDLFTVTDANGNQIKYENYFRGIARKETHPVKVASLQNIVLQRIVNYEGTVQSQTNGRGFTTSFTYDGLNRLKGINFPKPLSKPVAISRTSTSKTLTRGSYKEQVSYDGFGRPILVSRTDIARNETESASTSYDALGQKTFESYPFSTAYGSSSTGTSYQYDTLGRVTKITHPDTTVKSLTYLADNKVQETNERNNVTTYQFRSYGNPSDQVLINTTQAAEGITTDITRNVFGQITTVNQGGKVRSYGYDQNYYLERVTHPEIIGDTVFGRDNVGNMTSKKVGAGAAITYSYDESNRLTNITYQDLAAESNVTYIYDDNNNIKSIDNFDGLREYVYDENDNRISNSLSVSSLKLVTKYGFNTSDQLESITYPSARLVSYTPDALGRSRTASPFVTNVSYYPGGIQKDINYANGVTTSQTLDPRRRINRINTGTVVDLNYIYDGIGNVNSITNNIDPAFTISNMTYDGVDRLKTATGNWGLAQFSYDTRGNLLSKTLGANTLTYNYDATSERLLGTTGLEINNYGYDDYGNIKTDGTNTYVYTSAGDLVTATAGTTTLSYLYDGKNIRIRSRKNNVDTFYAYSDHNLMGEYDSLGKMNKEYIYLGSQQIAVIANSPEQPTTVTVTPPDINNSYTVSWAVSTGITHYELLETTSQSCTAGTAIYSGVNSNFNITNQTDGTYYYCVRACNGSNCSAYTFSGASCAVAGSTSAPCLPASITVPASNTTGTYTVSWGASTGTVSHYELQQDTSSNFATATTVYSGSGLSTSISPTTAACTVSCTYYYRVRACNNTACGLYLEASNPINVDLPVPLAPSQVNVPTANDTGTGNYTLSWTMPANPGTITHYEVEESLVSDFSTRKQVYSGTALTVNLTGKIDGVYYYRVRACNASLCSLYTAGANPVTVSGSPVLAAIMSIITNLLLN